jgi:hypothetical protein
VSRIAFIFQFPTAAAAQRDPVVGPYITRPASELLVHDLAHNSVVPLEGYWLLIEQPAPVIAALQSHPNVKLVIDRTLMLQGKPSVLFSTFANPGDLGIAINTLGVYVAQKKLKAAA